MCTVWLYLNFKLWQLEHFSEKLPYLWTFLSCQICSRHMAQLPELLDTVQLMYVYMVPSYDCYLLVPKPAELFPASSDSLMAYMFENCIFQLQQPKNLSQLVGRSVNVSSNTWQNMD